MVFSSALFLVGFLPVFLLAYLVVARTWKNAVALAGSLVFYTWGAPKFVFVLLASGVLDYLFSKRMTQRPSQGKYWLWAGLALNLGTLFVFKYFNFFIDSARAAAEGLGLHFPALAAIALPIGISFFTFQKVSYLVDVYRGDTPPAASIRDYLLFVSLFPQLIAGPIIRYKDLAHQITHRFENDGWDHRLAGFVRFAVGLAKKVLIADVLAGVADPAFESANPGFGPAWLGLLAYAFQVYFDFSGYSDMAIGLGQMMGFRFPENFNWPYRAQGFRAFWQRWHITLSTWMRDYLYIPLGGNRGSRARVVRNLWLVFLLSGLWHGASWNFVIWGAWHGLFLSLDRFTLLFRNTYHYLNVAVTFLLVLLGWVWFRADTLEGAAGYFEALVSFGEQNEVEVNARQWCTLVLAAAFGFVPRAWHNKLVSVYCDPLPFAWLRMLGALLLLLLCLGQLAVADGQPFIYFRF